MIIISYRIKTSIYQTQLTDFIGIKCIEKYDMNVPKDYRVARKKFHWIPIHPNRGKQANQTKKIMSKSQRTISDFINWVPKLKDKYLYRFPRVEIPRFEDFGLRVISKKEWDMHRYLKGFNGYFENLFEFNDFYYFDDLQERLEKEGVSFKNMFLKDIIAYELLRLNLGFKNYAGIEKMGRFTGEPPLSSITHDPKFFPKATDLSFVLTKFFITNVSQEKIKEIMSLNGIRCIINSNESSNFRELVNGSSFIFFNKKHNQFLNYELDEAELEFENDLISQSKNEAILQDKIQKLKSVATTLFTELNQNGNLNNLHDILQDYDKKYWNQILDYTCNYFDITIPKVDIKAIPSKKSI